MREWLEAKGDPEREKVVQNTRFGESYSSPKAFEDEEIFLRRRETYGAELPQGVLYPQQMKERAASISSMRQGPRKSGGINAHTAANFAS